MTQLPAVQKNVYCKGVLMEVSEPETVQAQKTFLEVDEASESRSRTHAVKVFFS